ncbi:hypothetical protein [Paenibacillus marchantiophytorum]|uniref:hypothetical protein n=1 Tax=Paenibacillus marchantiophytorum TaxID=1619310 RepID=UPI00166F24D0|nr:hypothetical protein [Paenibacillus marchantiophytorum]
MLAASFVYKGELFLRFYLLLQLLDGIPQHLELRDFILQAVVSVLMLEITELP